MYLSAFYGVLRRAASVTPRRSSPHRIAYMISAYKLPQMLGRLVRALHHDDDVCLIHVDRRTASSIFREMTGDIRGGNIHFLSRRRCRYRSYDHVQATLAGLRYLRENRIDYDHVVLLTGQDYPIKSRHFIHRWLAWQPHLSYMESFPLPTEGWPNGGKSRLDNAHFFVGKQVISLPRNSPAWLGERSIPGGLLPFGGSGYWALTREHADFALDFLETHPKTEAYFKWADVPDELVFQTILMNSAHRDNIANTNLRHVNWAVNREKPAIMAVDDLAALRASPHLFARKFTGDTAVLDSVDQWIAAMEGN